MFETDLVELCYKLMRDEKLTKEEEDLLKNDVFEKFKKYIRHFYLEETTLKTMELQKDGSDN